MKLMVKTAHKEQGIMVMDVSFGIRVILKAVFWYKDKVLQFKKCVWVLSVEVRKEGI